MSEPPAHLKQEYQVSSPESVELFNSASAGSVLGVRNALARGGKVNYFHRPEDQKNSLHIAAEQGHKAVVELLLQADAVVDCIVPSTKDTALILSCQSGSVEIAQMLFAKGADVNAQNCYGNTPLHVSARQGDYPLCKLMVEEGAIAQAVNHKGSTALHFFAYSDSSSISIAQLLIDAGCAIDAKCTEGRTPFLIAAMNGRVDLLDFFAAEGADIHAVDVSGDDGYGLAVFHKHSKCVKWFENRKGK